MKSIIIIITLFCSMSAYSVGLKTEDETRILCDTAAKQFGQGKIETSFNTLKEHWPLPEEEINNLIYQTKSKLQMVGDRFGTILGSDYINVKKAGNSFIRYNYIIKYKKHALRYVCTFYKPKDLWVLNSIVWDDETNKLFE